VAASSNGRRPAWSTTGVRSWRGSRPIAWRTCGISARTGDDATHVEITFSGSERGTTVRIVHSGWERLGAKGSDLRDRNRAGWDGLLPWFVEACEGAPV